MDEPVGSFGDWLRRRRKALDLTQGALALKVSCSAAAIRKIEADERRPSRALAQRLAQQLGVPPERQAAFLHAARQAGAVHPVLDDGAAPPQVAPAVPSPFVGRDAEYRRITSLMGRTEAGGHVVLLHGEAGIGKSRLLHEVQAHARRQRLPVLATNCYEIERAIAYQPVIELATRACELAGDALLRTLAPVLLAEIVALVPAAAARLPTLPLLSPDFPEARQARLFQALLQLFEAVATRRPLLLLVDNIQWADDASLRFLHVAARQAASRPLLLACAYRDEEEGGSAVALLAGSLRGAPHVHTIALAPLGLDDVQVLLERAGDAAIATPGLAPRLHRESEGNPFFLWSLLHALGEQADAPQLSLPDDLRDAVRVRLARVPVPDRVLLDAAAVLGRRFHCDTLQAISGMAAAPLLQSLDGLVRRRLLRAEEEGGHYDFSHDKVREVVYRDIAPARRALLHRQVAAQLEQHDAGDARDRSARLAEHCERGQDWSRALQYLAAAAEHSLRLFATREALHWFDRAVALLREHPRAAPEGQMPLLLERRGAARAQAGAIEGAVADFQSAIAAARARGEREHARDLLIQLGMAYRRADAYERATACLEEALATSRVAGDDWHVADGLYHLGTVAWSNGRNDRAIAHHQEAVALCERLGLADLAAVQAFHGRGEAHLAQARPHAAIASFSRSLALARAIDDRSYESENRMMVGWACSGPLGLADYPRALAEFDAALQIAQAADLQWHLAPIRIGQAVVQAALGRYGQAWDMLAVTLAQLQTLGLVRYRLMALDATGNLLLDLERPAQAAAQFEGALALARQGGVHFWLERLQAGLALARLRSEGPVDATGLREALQRARSHADEWMALRCMEVLAEVAATAGAGLDCIAYADDLLALGTQGGLREQVARAHWLRGLGLLAQGQARAAGEALQGALAQSLELGHLRLQWDCRVGLARVARQLGDASAGRAQEKAAAALAAARAESLRDAALHAAGAGLPSPSRA